MTTAYRLRTEWADVVQSKHPVTDSYHFSLEGAVDTEAAVRATGMAKSTTIEQIKIEQ